MDHPHKTIQAAYIFAVHIGSVVATFLLNTSRVSKALDLFKECLILLSDKALMQEQQLVRLFSIYIYNKMLNGYVLIRDYTRAIEYGEKLLILLLGSGENLEIKVTVQMASLHYYKRKYEEASKYYERALKFMKKAKLRQGEGMCYANLGCVFLSLGEHEKAKHFLEKALFVTKEIGDRHSTALIYGHQGIVYSALGENDKAKEYHEKSLEMWKETVAKNMEKRCRTPIWEDCCAGSANMSMLKNISREHLHSVSRLETEKSKQLATAV